MAFYRCTSVLVIFVAILKNLDGKYESPKLLNSSLSYALLNIYSSSFVIAQQRSAYVFAYSDTLLRHRHGRVTGPVLHVASISRIIQLFLVIANYCSTLNPGPAKHPCGFCEKPTKSNKKAIQCEECYF